MELVALEEEYSMEDAFEKWKTIVKAGSHTSATTLSTWGTSGTSVGAFVMPGLAAEYIEMTMTLVEPKAEDKQEPVKPAKPIKRYSKKEFKKKLKELCG